MTRKGLIELLAEACEEAAGMQGGGHPDLIEPGRKLFKTLELTMAEVLATVPAHIVKAASKKHGLDRALKEYNDMDNDLANRGGF